MEDRIIHAVISEISIIKEKLPEYLSTVKSKHSEASKAYTFISFIQKIIGFGTISEKFIAEDILWPDEKLFKKLIWKFRIKIKPIHIIKNWNNGIDSPKNTMLNTGRKVIQKNTFDSLTRDAMKKWKVSIKTC